MGVWLQNKTICEYDLEKIYRITECKMGNSLVSIVAAGCLLIACNETDRSNDVSAQEMVQETVETIVTKQCQFGQRSGEGHSVKKTTRWMSNCSKVLRAFDRRYAGPRGVRSATGTAHQQCSGRTARGAAIYPFVMCQAIVEGFRKYRTSIIVIGQASKQHCH